MTRASSRTALQALSLDAELAGAVMACRYSSSDEYEAALIEERRRAGAYRGQTRRSRDLGWAVLAVGLIAAGLTLLG